MKREKIKQINYTERTQIERWHNKDKKVMYKYRNY